MIAAKEKPARDCAPAGFEKTHCKFNCSDPTPKAQAQGKIRFNPSAAVAGFALGLLASIIAISAVVIAVAVVKGAA